MMAFTNNTYVQPKTCGTVLVAAKLMPRTSAPNGDEVSQTAASCSRTLLSPSAIGDGNVTATLPQISQQINRRQKHCRNLSSRCERSPSNYALSRPLRGRQICAKSAARHCTYFSVAQWVGLNCTLDLKQREAVDGRPFAGFYCN
jgi:hypothetical protein